MAMATSAKLRRREAPPHGCTAAGFHQVLQGLQQDRQHSGLPGRQQHLRQDLVEGADCLHALHDPGCWALLTCSMQGVHAVSGSHLRTVGAAFLHDMLCHEGQARQQQRHEHTLEGGMPRCRQQLRQLLQRTAGKHNSALATCATAAGRFCTVKFCQDAELWYMACKWYRGYLVSVVPMGELTAAARVDRAMLAASRARASKMVLVCAASSWASSCASAAHSSCASLRICAWPACVLSLRHHSHACGLHLQRGCG